MSNTEYATTEELNYFCGMNGEIPELPITNNEDSLENVGTGDNNTIRFFLDKTHVIADTYDLFAGTSVNHALNNELTETTQYVLDKDKGIITLTSNGLTSVGINKIYAQYKYNNLGIKDSEMQSRLNQAAIMIDSLTNNHFVNGTDATPGWEVVSDETHYGRGFYDRQYSLDYYPVASVKTTLTSSVGAGQTSVAVSSTNGFPSSGVFGLGTNKVSYTGKSSTVFTGCSGISVGGVTSDSVSSYVFEVSGTDRGTTPVWVVQEEDTDFSFTEESGNVELYGASLIGTSSLDKSYPENLCPERFRASYLWGTSSVPEDIKQLTLMVASRQLMNLAVRKAHSNGINSFEPSVLDCDQSMIDLLVKRYRCSKVKRI
jgi:hypothetical protein